MTTIQNHLKAEFAKAVSVARSNQQVIVTLDSPIVEAQLPVLNSRLSAVLTELGKNSGSVPDELLDALLETIGTARIAPTLDGSAYMVTPKDSGTDSAEVPRSSETKKRRVGVTSMLRPPMARQQSSRVIGPTNNDS